MAISWPCGFYHVVQADILARYRPKINVSLLVPTLKKAEKSSVDALRYFKSTHHMFLYYEDLVHNRTVSSHCFWCAFHRTRPGLISFVSTFCTETRGCARVPGVASEKARESPCQDSHEAIVRPYRELGWSHESTQRNRVWEILATWLRIFFSLYLIISFFNLLFI